MELREPMSNAMPGVRVSDSLTVNSRQSAQGWSGTWALGIRVLAHPDVARVDDAVVLFDERAEGEARICRNEPIFRRSDGEATGPLATVRVSRRPVVLRKEADGLDVLPLDDAGEHVFLDEKPLRARERLSPARLEKGVLLRFGKYVLIWLGRIATGGETSSSGATGLLGHSRSMRELRAEVARICDLSVSVLLRGQSGSGKEAVARAIHAAGPRSAGPFVAVNAAAVAAHTGALELFGERDAVPGAHRGYFAAAEGGTLFLDQLASAPAEVQALLGRALDGRVIQPVGGGLKQVDARVIASTEDDLSTAVAQGRLKPALLRRFGYELVVPSLAERRDDIASLFLAFLREETSAIGEPDRLAGDRTSDDAPVWLNAEFIARLVLREWPGNLDDLRKAARRFAVFNRGRERASVPPDLLAPAASEADVSARPVAERRVQVSELSDEKIADALRRNAFVVDATAEDLGVSRSWLHTHLNESPAFRKAKDLTEAEIREALRQNANDLTAAALALCVSRRGLQLQMSRFGLRP